MNGLGQCGCCGPTYDDKERFAYAFANWSGRLLTADTRSLKVTYTWTFTVQKRYRDNTGDHLWPTGDVEWTWTNQRIDTCNRYTNEWTYGTPALLSGSLPPGSWDPATSPDTDIPRSDVNYLPTDEAMPDYWTSGVVGFHSYREDNYYYWYGPWYYDAGVSDWVYHVGYPPFPNLGAGQPYYLQTCRLQILWASAAPDIYTLADFASDWAELYAKLSFATIATRMAANADFHFASYLYNSSGQIVERYTVERSDVFESGGAIYPAGYTNEDIDWRDKWTKTGGVWWHDVGLYCSLGPVIPPPDEGSQYTEIVDGGAESAAQLCASARLWQGADIGWTAPYSHPINLPHSTYSYLQSYSAPVVDAVRGGIAGIPDLLDAFSFDQTGVNIGHDCYDAANLWGATAIARITAVPLPSAVHNFVIRRYWFDAANSTGVNPDGCTHQFVNQDDKYIEVQCDDYAFELVRAETIQVGETQCPSNPQT